jgi:uncharacterized coiled-coil protein SlyX
MDELRVVELESKVSHHEIAIEELQKTLYEQHLIVEKLEKSLKQFTGRLDEALGPDVGPGNQKPPHY